MSKLARHLLESTLPPRSFESSLPPRSLGSGLPPRSVAPSLRGALDALVQGSLVDLFTAYNVAIAPQPRLMGERAPAIPELSAAIGFARQGAPGQPGKLTLSLPGAVVDLMRADQPSSLRIDWARELANQLMGRIKNRLLQFDVRLLVAVSTSMESAMLERQLRLSPNVRVYGGRTLRGDAVVTIDGLPDEAELCYVGPMGWPTEGDALLF